MAYNKVPTDKTPVEKHRFTWNIPNFAQVRNSSGDVPRYRFVMGSSIGLPSTWECFLEERQGNIGVFVTHVETGEPVPTSDELPIDYGVKIDGGKYVNGRFGTSKLKNMVGAVGGWGFPKAIKKTDSPQKILPLNPDGSLSIDIEINLYNFNLEASLEANLVKLKTEFDTKFCNKLQSDLESMYENPGTSSAVPRLVTVVSSDDKEFKVSTANMAARSTVFMSMFQTPMVEAEQGVVKIDDISGVALDALLRFMITGKLPGNWSDVEILEELTYAAHKYLLEDLLEFLDQALGLVATKQNCGRLLDLAKKLNLKQAEKELMGVVKRHLQNGDWDEIKQFFKDNLEQQ